VKEDEKIIYHIVLSVIRSCFECTNKYNGTEGSPWKKYISRAHDILIFHNVVTGQKIFDYEVSKKQVKTIVLDDCRSYALVEERRNILKMRSEDYELQRKTHAAAIVQRAFRRRCRENGVGNKALKRSLYKFLM